METIPQIIAALVAKAMEGGVDSVTANKAIADALQQHAQPVFQAVFDRGHSAASTASKAKITELEGQVTAANAKVEAAEANVRALSGKTPDVEKIRADHQKALDDAKAEHQKALDTLTRALDTERASRDAADMAIFLADAGMLTDWTKDFAAKPELVSRIRRDEHGNRVVLQKGSDSVYLQVAAGVDPLKALAAEYVPTVDARYRSATADGGSGTGGSSTGGAGSGTYDPAAEGAAAGKAQREAIQRGNENALR